MEWLWKFFHQIYDVKGVITHAGYLGLSAIIFTETGLLIGFFLPGDSLLFTAGLACNPASELHAIAPLDLLTLNLCLIPAAIIGDSVGYWIGKRAGVKLYEREKTLFFRKDHLLKTKEFYEKYGGITIVLARFVPLIRTFAPVVAGIAQMSYRRFLAYNIFGGIGWVIGLSVLGYFLGGIPAVGKNLEVSIMAVIAVSLLPVVITVVKAKLADHKAPAAKPGGTDAP
jgi:membrane-associated protein